jgi:hypothetical protein
MPHHPSRRVAGVIIRDIGYLGREMEVSLIKALGISLEEVRAHQFQQGSSCESIHVLESGVGEEPVEERNFRDAIENHYQSRRYETKDIDAVPFTTYNSDD